MDSQRLAVDLSARVWLAAAGRAREPRGLGREASPRGWSATSTGANAQRPGSLEKCGRGMRSVARRAPRRELRRGAAPVPTMRRRRPRADVEIREPRRRKVGREAAELFGSPRGRAGDGTLARHARCAGETGHETGGGDARGRRRPSTSTTLMPMLTPMAFLLRFREGPPVVADDESGCLTGLTGRSRPRLEGPKSTSGGGCSRHHT